MTDHTETMMAQLASQDMRTTAGRDAEILAYLREDGELSVRWLYEHRSRPAAVARLEKAGTIRRLTEKDALTLRFQIVGERRGFMGWLRGLFA